MAGISQRDQRRGGGVGEQAEGTIKTRKGEIVIKAGYPIDEGGGPDRTGTGKLIQLRARVTSAHMSPFGHQHIFMRAKAAHPGVSGIFPVRVRRRQQYITIRPRHPQRLPHRYIIFEDVFQHVE